MPTAKPSNGLLARLNEYIDWVSEFDTDDTSNRIKQDCGGNNFGYLSPFYLNLKRGARWKSLVIMFGLAFILAYGIFIMMTTAYLSLDFDEGYTVIMGTFSMISGISLLTYCVSFLNHRVQSLLFSELASTFRYDDFIDSTEERLRGRLKKLSTFAKIFWGSCIYLVGVTQLPLVYWDSLQRNEDDLPDWFKKDLVMPMWWPVDVTSNLFLSTLSVLFLVILSLVVCQTMFAFTNLASQIGISCVTEANIMTEAVIKMEQRTQRVLETFPEENSSKTAEKMVDYQKAQAICIKKIIKHHCKLLRIVRLTLQFVDEFLVVMVYLSGFILGTGIYCALDKNRSNSIRMFSACVSTVLGAALSIFCFLGQQISSAFDKFEGILYFADWINWDKQSKGLLRTLMTMTAKPVVVKSSYLDAQLNYPLIESIVTTCYSFINLVTLFKK